MPIILIDFLLIYLDSNQQITCRGYYDEITDNLSPSFTYKVISTRKRGKLTGFASFYSGKQEIDVLIDLIHTLLIFEY